MATAVQKITIIADDQTANAIASAIRNAQKLDTQLKKTETNMRGMTRQGRAQMAQLGHQMQDIAVQFQMGMNPLMILGQQGSQIASIFGAKGAVFGSILAVGALIGSVFVPQLFKGSDAAGEFTDKIIKAAGGVDKLTEAQRRLAQLDLQLRIGEQQAAVEKAKRSLQDYINGFQTLVDQQRLNPFAFAEDQLPVADPNKIIEFNQAIEIANAQLSVTQAQMDALTGKTARAEAAIKALASAQELAQKKANRDALERMKLIAASMTAEQKFLMESQRLQKILQGPDGVFDSVEIEAYRVAVEDLAGRLFQAGNATDELSDADQKLQENMKALNEAFKRIGEEGLKKIEDGFVNLINGSKSVKDSFRDMARSIIDDLIRMQVRANITGPLQSLMTGFFAGPSKNPIPVQELSSPAGTLPTLNGGGFTGMGARAGGVDGKGGFPAILHPNETVLDHTQGQGMGGVNVTLNISTGVSQTVRAEIVNLLPQITAATKAAVADARQRGGGYSKSLVGA